MTAVYRQYPWGICSRVLTGFPSSRIVTINFKTRVHFSRLLRLLGNFSEEETIEGAVYTRLGRPRLHYPCIHAYPSSNDRPRPPKYWLWTRSYILNREWPRQCSLELLCPCSRHRPFRISAYDFVLELPRLARVSISQGRRRIQTNIIETLNWHVLEKGTTLLIMEYLETYRIMIAQLAHSDLTPFRGSLSWHSFLEYESDGVWYHIACEQTPATYNFYDQPYIDLLPVLMPITGELYIHISLG